MAKYQCANCHSTFNSPMKVCPVCGATQIPPNLEQRALPVLAWFCLIVGVGSLLLIIWGLLQGPPQGTTWAQQGIYSALTMLICVVPPLAAGAIFFYLHRHGR